MEKSSDGVLKAAKLGDLKMVSRKVLDNKYFILKHFMPLSGILFLKKWKQSLKLTILL